MIASLFFSGLPKRWSPGNRLNSIVPWKALPSFIRQQQEGPSLFFFPDFAMNAIIDLLASMMAFVSVLLEAGSTVFWKSCFLIALAGLIVKIFSEQIYPRTGSFFKK
jgi:hypothetical protein